MIYGDQQNAPLTLSRVTLEYKTGLIIILEGSDLAAWEELYRQGTIMVMASMLKQKQQDQTTTQEKKPDEQPDPLSGKEMLRNIIERRQK